MDEAIIEEINTYRDIFSDDISCIFNILSNISNYNKECFYEESITEVKEFLTFLYDENKISHFMYNKVLYNDDYLKDNTITDIFNIIDESLNLMLKNNFIEIVKETEEAEKRNLYRYLSQSYMNHFLAKYICGNKEELEVFFEDVLYCFMKDNDNFDLFNSEGEKYEKYFEKIYDSLKIYYLIENKYNKYHLQYEKQINKQKEEDIKFNSYINQKEMFFSLINSEEDIKLLKKEFFEFKSKLESLNVINYSLY